MPRFTQKEIEQLLKKTIINEEYQNHINIKELTNYINDEFCWELTLKQAKRLIQSFIHKTFDITIIPLTEFIEKK